jgi:hypothetical protein
VSVKPGQAQLILIEIKLKTMLISQALGLSLTLGE